MDITPVDPPNMKDPGLSQGVLVTGYDRLLFITGQAPLTHDQPPPDGFEAQARLVWNNVLAVLAEAGMTTRNLVKVNTYLARREDRDVSSKLRQEILDGHKPSLCIIVCDMWDGSWLLEIDAIAAA